ncbi:hypothetical protein [Synechococcus phage metaG-MbCM1]|uniref:OMP1 protein n=1 Tax=Synechococcus phage metaG-MbCM1 TaxID=1079999 RepID=H8ZNE7_9CAUD|nr:hypothetical protein [Synechococcus phage metaG-MbCM1]AFD03008.1 hypothetical protein [Synechococcus phage metaG-MbCM1]
MKKILPLVMLLMAGSAAHAGGIVSKHQSSLQHTVEAGYNSYTRVGNAFSISGTNVTTSHTPSGGSAVSGGIGINSYSATTGVASVGEISATQTGSGSFNFSQSFTAGDAAGSGTDEALFGNQVQNSGGTAGSAAVGTVTNAHAVTLTGGGLAGTTTTGQFVSEISVFD